MTAPNTPFLAKPEIPFLLLEGVAPTAVEILTAAGYGKVRLEKAAMSEDALIEALAKVRFLGVRSRTQITRRVIEAAPRLAGIGCYSVGTNQVDLEAAREFGVPVFNAPFSNTRSVAELTIAEIIMLYRRVFPRSNAAHAGDWRKSAADSPELARDPRQDAGHRRLWQYREPVGRARRGDGNAYRLLRPDRQVAARQCRADRQSGGAARR